MNCCYTVRKNNFRKTCAVFKCITANSGQGARQTDLSQVTCSLKSTCRNACYTFRNNNLCQAATSAKYRCTCTGPIQRIIDLAQIYAIIESTARYCGYAIRKFYHSKIRAISERAGVNRCQHIGEVNVLQTCTTIKCIAANCGDILRKGNRDQGRFLFKCITRNCCYRISTQGGGQNDAGIAAGITGNRCCFIRSIDSVGVICFIADKTGNLCRSHRLYYCATANGNDADIIIAQFVSGFIVGYQITVTDPRILN